MSLKLSNHIEDIIKLRRTNHELKIKNLLLLAQFLIRVLNARQKRIHINKSCKILIQMNEKEVKSKSLKVIKTLFWFG